MQSNFSKKEDLVFFFCVYRAYKNRRSFFSSAILMNPMSPEIRLASRDLGSRMFIPSSGSGGGGSASGGGGGVNTAAGRLSTIINAVQSSHSNTNTLPIIR